MIRLEHMEQMRNNAIWSPDFRVPEVPRIQLMLADSSRARHGAWRTEGMAGAGEAGHFADTSLMCGGS